MAETVSQEDTNNRNQRISQRADELYATDLQYKNALPSDEQIAKINGVEESLAIIIETVMDTYAQRPALGQRKKQLSCDPVTGETTAELLPEYETITYQELSDRYHWIANSWSSALSPQFTPGDFIAFLGFTSIDYVSLDLAATHIGGVLVPLQTNSTTKQIIPVLEETNPRIIAVGLKYFATALPAIQQCSSLQRVVVFDYDPRIDKDRELFASLSATLAESQPEIVVVTYAEELSFGKTLPPVPGYNPPSGSDPLQSLIYTSGSTGTPKGAMFTERIIRQSWQTNSWAVETQIPAILLHYMPLSHIFGRAWITIGLKTGGIGYFSTESDMSTLFDDLRIARPTMLSLVPRVCDMVLHIYQQEIDQISDGQEPSDAIIAQVKERIKNDYCGGRILWTLCGSAPLDPEVRNFMVSVLDIPINDAYGATEIGGSVIINTDLNHDVVLDYRLVDVPELGYYATDKPHPRGELYVKTINTIPGYFHRPDITEAIFTPDGLYKTGDIMEEIAPGKLIYLDRCNNVIKLSQGEFVPVAQIEAAFSNIPIIKQIYIYGNSDQPFLLAVIVPNYPILALDGITEPERVKEAIASSLRAIAQELELNSYEIPRDFIVESTPFSQSNGLLSGIGKLVRPNLKAKYYNQLQDLYHQINDQQLDKISALIAQRDSTSIVHTVAQAAIIALGLPLHHVDESEHFADLGGDSLTAFSFALLLEKIFGIPIPVQTIIAPTATLATIADYIDKQRSGGSHRPTCADIHGKDSTVVFAHDLTIDKFIDNDTLTAARRLPAYTGTARTVLLTGANGYLGHFMCLRWLEEVVPLGGKVICIARGADQDQAKQRIAQAFDTGDAALKEHFDSLAQHLEVIVGDVGEYHLGVDEETWAILASSVDFIVHVAAFVNHVLPYDQLFGPNTLGTAEIISLAITQKIKPINYISTVAVLGLSQEGFFEDQDIRTAVPQATIDDTYANGYAVSKWAGEVLLRDAYEKLGLPVTVFRCDMILADSRYTGQLNVADMFTRTILSLIITGIAPGSFYENTTPADKQLAHYDGLPADFVSEAITTIGKNGVAGYHTYNVLNSNNDGISLDVFVDWLIQAGYPISRIEDFDQWYQRFESALIGLPEKIKQHSVLPLLHAYKKPIEIHAGDLLPTTKFREAVQHAQIGSEHDIPHLTRELIEKYATDLQQLGLL